MLGILSKDLDTVLPNPPDPVSVSYTTQGIVQARQSHPSVAHQEDLLLI